MYRENICYNCKYEDCDPNKNPCNTCIIWLDGYLTAQNYVNKYLDSLNVDKI